MVGQGKNEDGSHSGRASNDIVTEPELGGEVDEVAAKNFIASYVSRPVPIPSTHSQRLTCTLQIIGASFIGLSIALAIVAVWVTQASYL